MVVALILWQSEFANLNLLFRIDNMSVVQVINQSESKSERFMYLIHKLVLFACSQTYAFGALHIRTKQKIIADCLVHSWTDSAPQADPQRTSLPVHILEYLNGKKLEYPIVL